MKIAIGILVLSTLFYFLPIKVQSFDSFNFWSNVKFISFFLMIGSFIAILIMW